MFIMYTMDGCVFCQKAIEYIQNHLKEKVELRNVKIKEHFETIQRVLPNETTVPQIFYNNKHVGGYNDLVRDF